MVGPGGLEPPTNGLWVHCSNQLSYRPLVKSTSASISLKKGVSKNLAHSDTLIFWWVNKNCNNYKAIKL